MKYTKNKVGNKMKKIILNIIIFVLFVGILLGLTGCSNNQNNIKSDEVNNDFEEEKILYHIGDTVLTDIAEFTLNNSEFAIAMSNVSNDNYFTPKEYNPNTDVGLGDRYLAEVGKTFVYCDFTITACSRSGLNIEELASEVIYNNQKYPILSYYYGAVNHIKSSYYNVKEGVWEKSGSSNIMMLSGDKSQVRVGFKISTEVENLKDSYEIKFELPNSKGEKEKFSYLVTK